MKEIKWGSPIGVACVGVFLGGLGLFFNAVWSNFL